ncbi:DNA/RNA endonuclease G [Herbiconiux sp. A18JL235]|uniref:DNA/RNA endonuclease G n=1 Tax=Herbiconiux sp. A18JL235 TaxID=3152363 RepID=A0AB39BHZ5_9MICO
MTDPALRRVVRRETHSPRTVATVVVLVLVALALAYLGTEIVLRLAGAGPLLVAPAAGLDWLVSLPSAQPAAAVVAGAAVIAVLGVVLIVLAIGAGRLPKHRMGPDAVVVDNGVIASALAQHVADEHGLRRDEVTVGIAHRTADVTVHPEAGTEIDRFAVIRTATDELDRYELDPRVRVRARVHYRQEKEPAS